MYNRVESSPVHIHYGKTHTHHRSVLSRASVSMSELLVEIVRDPPSSTSITAKIAFVTPAQAVSHS